MNDPRILRLRQVAELVQARAAAELGANKHADISIQDKVSALRNQKIGTGPDAFQRAGGEQIWRQWRDREIAALNRERALLRVAQERLAEASARATARVQALDRLLEKP
ncbi:hypothetical protein [Meridianimarinicoccus aquatilis]|uniref:Uncharacterized protein n=1 Tax=Meridianimarinicoccus aquatilis TaxID=2552766 RepID=A0A4R6B2X3_9RHOB|nr:hypothetical protein [Fluviibacterium aquatile]TDL90565.1 hypothetical protein E2L05_04585 [Fluviibacterium aquatile]